MDPGHKLKHAAHEINNFGSQNGFSTSVEIDPKVLRMERDRLAASETAMSTSMHDHGVSYTAPFQNLFVQTFRHQKIFLVAFQIDWTVPF